MKYITKADKRARNLQLKPSPRATRKQSAWTIPPSLNAKLPDKLNFKKSAYRLKNN